LCFWDVLINFEPPSPVSPYVLFVLTPSPSPSCAGMFLMQCSQTVVHGPLGVLEALTGGPWEIIVFL